MALASWSGTATAAQANSTNSSTGWSDNSGINGTINASASMGALNLALFSMPDTRQSTEYSCGAACLQAVLGYWGRDIGEEDIREMLNTAPNSDCFVKPSGGAKCESR